MFLLGLAFWAGSGGSGNPARDTDISPSDGILCFFMETAKRASRPVLLWLLGKVVQVCFHLVLTRFSLGDGVSPPFANRASWLGWCPWRKALTFVPAGHLCPRTEEYVQLSARVPRLCYLPGQVRAWSLPAYCCLLRWGSAACLPPAQQLLR